MHDRQNLNALQRTASLASTLFSITSLIIGVSYLWQHRSRSNPGSLQLVRLYDPFACDVLLKNGINRYNISAIGC